MFTNKPKKTHQNRQKSAQKKLGTFRYHPKWVITKLQNVLRDESIFGLFLVYFRSLQTNFQRNLNLDCWEYKASTQTPYPPPPPYNEKTIFSLLYLADGITTQK